MQTDPNAYLVRVSDLKPWANNPRVNAHAVPRVAASIREFGFGAPIIVRAADRELIAGHTRLAAAVSLGLEHVPVRVMDLTPEQAHALAVADNRLGELAEWDEERLALVLDELPSGLVELTGFGDEPFKLDDERSPLPGEQSEPEPADEPPEYEVQAGDTFEVVGRAKHLVHCGDGLAFKPPVAVGVMIHDPPWELEARSSVWARSTLAFCDGGRAGQTVAMFGEPTWVFVWDCGACWYTKNRPLRKMKMCFWYGPLEDFDFDGAHYGEPGEAGTVTNSRGTYDYVPDPRGKHLSDVFAASLTALHAGGSHPHEKPLDWIRLLIGDCSRGVVFDPFLGSGTSVLAADQLGRPSYGVELDPAVLSRCLSRFAGAGLRVTRL